MKHKKIVRNKNSEHFTFKQQLFIKVMTAMPDFNCKGNASKAARMAGYKSKNAGIYACELLKNPKIKAAIEENRKKLLQKFNITAERILQELAAVAFSNINDFYDDSGNFKKLINLPRHVTAALCSYTVQSKVDNGGNQTVTTAIKIHDKLRALELLGNYLNLWSGKAVHPCSNNQVSADERAKIAQQKLIEILGPPHMDDEKIKPHNSLSTNE